MSLSIRLFLAVVLAFVAGKGQAAPALDVEATTQRLIVKFKDDAATTRSALPVQNRIARLAQYGHMALSHVRPMALGAHVVSLDQSVSLSAARAIADSLAANPDVEYAQPDRWIVPMLVPNDPFVSSQTYLDDSDTGVSAFGAWNITTGSAETVVAVVDSGYRPHAGLAGRFLPGYDFVSDPVVANDGGGRDPDALDPGDWISQTDVNGAFKGDNCRVENSNWHGTAVAGVIGANGNDHAWTAGLDWAARILPIRALGKCFGAESDILDGVAWAAGLSVPGVPSNATPAQVINMSLGGRDTGTCGSHAQAVFNAALAHGVTRAIVVSAGNADDNAAGHEYGNCGGVISVAATNSRGAKASYSNFGPTITISAPGGDFNVSGIYVLVDSGSTTAISDTIAVYAGTSFAAPVVSGVISLMLAVAPNLVPIQIRSILTSSAKPFPAGSSCAGICGAGIVNAQAAVLAAQAAAGTASYTDLWWFGQNHNGTGVSIIEHNDALFATWYLYDPNGKGSWFVMPGGAWNAAHTDFSGTIYAAIGAPFNNYSPPPTGTELGTMTLRFSDSSTGTLSYVLTTGVSGSLPMTRQAFGAAGALTHLDYSDLWWGGPSENGWGLTLNQHFNTLVAIWYTYGLDGKPVYYIMPDGAWTDAENIAGPIYATVGTPFGSPYDPAQFSGSIIGHAAFAFSDASHASFTYTVDGVGTQTKAIVRQSF